MNDNLTLEAALERRASTEKKDAEILWNKYKAVKDYLAEEYYRWVQAKCPFFTDHGENHIQSVIQAASLLLKKHLNPGSKSELSSLDIFLILSAILWHDVGNVLGRSEHASRVGEMTNKIRRLGFPNIDIQRLVEEISKAHAGEDGLNIPRLYEDCTINQTYTVYPKALAAIVRFADEISEDRTKISQSLLPEIPDENRIFWEYANCISASKPEPERYRVVVTVAIQDDVAIRKFRCPEQCRNRADSGGNISLIEYVVCRLEKMNNERAYCALGFSRYVSIMEIVARFTMLRGTERVENYELEVNFSQSGYPNIPIFDNFFERHPNWQPEKIREVLTNE